jgi:hypothetical protein
MQSPTDLQRAVFDALGDALQEDRHEKILLCRLLARLCVIDGELHPAERVVLDATMVRYALRGDERQRIDAEMRVLLGEAGDAPAIADAAADVDALIGTLAAAALRELLVHLEHGAWADGKLVPAETAFMDRVRARLQSLGQ